jgi:hypothetical protein
MYVLRQAIEALDESKEWPMCEGDIHLKSIVDILNNVLSSMPRPLCGHDGSRLIEASDGNTPPILMSSWSSPSAIPSASLLEILRSEGSREQWAGNVGRAAFFGEACQFLVRHTPSSYRANDFRLLLTSILQSWTRVCAHDTNWQSLVCSIVWPGCHRNAHW